MQDRDYAIIVGINRYPLLKDLEGSVKDAEAFTNWVKTGGGVPEKNVRTILSDTPPKPGDRPVLDEIDKAFAELFKLAAAEPARRLYCYFAGHGCSAESDHLALLMANAEKDFLNRAMNASEYHRVLAKRPLFKEQVIFYDCCRNYDERVTGRNPEWDDGKPPAGTAEIKQFVMYAAAFTQFANEKAIELTDKRGLFTKALIEGLEGKAAKRSQGKWVVTTMSLVPYVTMRLQELATPFSLSQKPSLGPGAAEELVLAEVPPALQTVVVTVPGVGDETVVIVMNDRLKEIMRGAVRNGAVQFDLVFATYVLTIAGAETRQLAISLEPGGPNRFEM
jgi:hypothetical protein